MNNPRRTTPATVTVIPTTLATMLPPITVMPVPAMTARIAAIPIPAALVTAPALIPTMPIPTTPATATMLPPIPEIPTTTPTTAPATTLSFSRHPRTALPVHAQRGYGQPIRGSLAANVILEEIPEGDYFARIILDTRPSGYATLTKNRSGRFFPTTLARGENISFEDDGLKRMTVTPMTTPMVMPVPPPPATATATATVTMTTATTLSFSRHPRTALPVHALAWLRATDSGNSGSKRHTTRDPR